MAEITLKSTLLECLSIMREEQRIVSKNYNCLEPAKGMEEAWEQGRRKIQILQEHIQSLDSEHVLKALAEWQKEEKPPKENNTDFGIPMGGFVEINDKMTLAPVDLSTIVQKNLDHEDGTMELR